MAFDYSRITTASVAIARLDVLYPVLLFDGWMLRRSKSWPSRTKTAQLLMPQRVDRIEACGSPGRKKAEDDANPCGKEQGQ
jgi:hypothetical protein